MSWLQELFDYDDYVELWTYFKSLTMQTRESTCELVLILFGTLYMQGLPL